MINDAGAETFGPQYHVDGVLGEGATAVVYSAYDTTNDSRVAIKWLRAGSITDRWGARFLREIAFAKSLDHPNLVRFIATGEVDGRPFAVMPLIEGETLRSRLSREVQLPLDDVLRITAQIAEAIDYAHGQGILHRDLKPENIMLSGDRVLVLDFGIARALEQVTNDRVTLTGVAVGTPYYMSPEQSAADPHVDRRSDVYALACITYEMLAGAPPFTGATMQAVRARQALETPARVRVVRPHVPECVDQALQRGLAKVPADRPATCGTFARDLRQPSVSTSILRARWPWAVGALFAALLIVAAYRLLPPSSARAVPTWILVGRLEASAPEQELAAAIEELLRSEFSRSPKLAVVTADQVQRALQAASLPDTTTLTRQRASEVAMRSNVALLLTGTVHRLSADRISLTVSVVHADSGKVVATRAANFGLSGDELVQRIAGLTRELRREIGDSSASFGPDGQNSLVSTPSFKAFKLYANGLDAARAGQLEGSTRMLKQAVREDTAFAAAWSMLANNFVATRQPDSARMAFSRALSHLERLSPADADRARGDAAFHADHDAEAATQWYRRYLEQRPLSLSGWNNLGLYLSALGRDQEALEAFERAATIDPFFLGPRQIELLNVAAELVVTGRLDSARRVASRLRGPDSTYMRMLLLNASNQWDTLAVESERLADSPTTESYVRTAAQLHAAGARAALGDSAAAMARLARMVDEAHGGKQRLFVHTRLLFDLVRGEPSRWPLPPDIVSDTSVGSSFLRAVHAAQRGDSAAARRQLVALTIRRAAVGPQLGAGLPYLELLLSRQGSSSDVRERLLRAAKAGEHDPFSVDRPSSVALRWLGAETLAASGRDGEAAAMRAVMRAPTGMPPAQYPLRGFVVRRR